MAPALQAQKEAAAIFGAEKTYFVLNGTSTSNKVALAALVGRYQFTLLNGVRVRERPEISNMPSPVLVRVERRAD